MEVRKILEEIAKALVDKPSEVSVQEINGKEATVFEVSVASNDIGKVIGKDGRTVNSLRNLLGAIGSKNKRRYSIEILD